MSLCVYIHTQVIDLAQDGFIKPHVDNIKFSGGFVCGLSLLSPAIMRLKGKVPTTLSINLSTFPPPVPALPNP